MTGTEIYKRTATYEAKAREIKIHAPHWKLLLAYDGVKSLSEVALTAEMSFADALPLTQKFLDEDWIAEQPITLDQYLKRIGTKDISPGAAVPPPTVLHEPGQATPSIAAAPLPVAPAPAVSAPQASDASSRYPAARDSDSAAAAALRAPWHAGLPFPRLQLRCPRRRRWAAR